jgi:hypothetical protein
MRKTLAQLLAVSTTLVIVVVCVLFAWLLNG